MRAPLIVIVILSAAVGLAASLLFEAREPGSREVAAVPAAPATAVSSTGSHGTAALRVKAATRKAVGQFRLRGGGTLRLETADTEGGHGCLVDVEVGAASGSSCFEGGLFAQQKVAFSVNFDGGPDRFRTLYVLGIAAPGVAAVTLSKSDGTSARLELNGARAFLYESSAAELARNVLPSGLEAFGPSGRLVERIAIPSLR